MVDSYFICMCRWEVAWQANQYVSGLSAGLYVLRYMYAMTSEYCSDE